MTTSIALTYAELFAGAPNRFLRRLKRDGDCIVWTGQIQSGRGYGLMWWKGMTRGAHRIAAEIGGLVVEGRVVMHSCDNPACVNPQHLSVGTHEENQRDKVRKGRQARGGRQGHAKLSESQVLAVRARVSSGERQASVAKDLGVSLPTINGIIKRRTWAWL